VVVIAKRVGRLANRLLLFAHFIAAAVEHQFVVLNPSFVGQARYFPSTAGDLLCRFPAGRKIPVFPGSRELLYYGASWAAEVRHWRQRLGLPAGLIRLRREDRLDLNSEAFLDVVRGHRVVFVQDWFFRNSDNCVRHREVVRAYFTPWEHRLEQARAVLEPARRRDRFVVGIHIRRGDYKTFKQGRYYYSHEQYRDAMEGVQAVFPHEDVAFLVCSDEPVPAGAFTGLDVTYGNGHELDDLYALAMCDALVGPPSTYTAWASYYGDVPLHVIHDPCAAPELGSFTVNEGLGSRAAMAAAAA
jgi:hypothetical protein